MIVFPAILTSISNASGDESGSSRSIDLVVPVLRGDDDTIVADVVTSMANNENLASSNRAKGLITVSIAECYNGGDTRGSGG